MAKRITMQQRLVSFGLEAVGLELDAAIETLQAIRNSRFPKQTKAAAVRKPRKPRTPAASTPAASNAAEPSASES